MATAQEALHFGPVQQIRPVYARPVLAMHKTAGGFQIDSLGQRIDLSGEVRPTSAVTAPAYDGLEFDPALIGSSMTPGDNPAYGGPCTGASTGTRFLTSVTTVDGGYMSEINAIPGTAGKLCNRLGMMWYIVSAAAHEQATLAWTSDNFVTGPSGLNPNSATVRSDLGQMWLLSWPTASAGMAYTGDADFGPGTSGWPMPADGRGALSVVHGDYNASTNQFTVGNSQQMRWIIKTGNPTPADYGYCWRDRLLLNKQWDGTWNGSTDEFESRTTSTACNSNNPPIIKTGRTTGLPCTVICASLLFVPTIVVTPTAFSVGIGQVTSGNLSSLANDDGNVLKVCKAFVPNFSSPRVRVDVDFLSPVLVPESVQLDVLAQMTSGGSFAIRTFLANTSGSGTLTFDASDQIMPDSPIDTVLSHFTSGEVSPENHIDTDSDATPNGTVRARLEIMQTGFTAVSAPCTAIDSVRLTVNP